MKRFMSVFLSVLFVTAVFFSFEVPAAADEPQTKVLLCDVNGDGRVNNKDVTLLFRFVSGKNVTVIENNADFDMDSEINNKDVVMLFAYLSGAAVYPAIYDAGPAYEVKGDVISVNGVEYPNNKNMTNGALYAVDDLGREVRLDAGPYEGEKYVGVFYFLWLGQHGDDGVFDITRILEEGGDAAKKNTYEGWGSVGAMHFWGEPLYGYYYSSDKWVLRRHVDELTEAGVDFVFIDATNGYPYLSNAKALMKRMSEFNAQGFDAPQIVFYTHTKCAETVKKIYDGIYAANQYPDTWFKIDGKPVIVAYEDDCRKALDAGICDAFTFREPQWPTEAQKLNGWPWMDFCYPQRVTKNSAYESEVINVSVAQHNGTICFSDSGIYGRSGNRGRSYHDGKQDKTENAVLYGYNFQEQWDRAIQTDVPYVLVTGWNEWVAQRQNPTSMGRAETEVVFVDTATMEYSRDIEPMRGGYFDNYYMQLADNIRRFKGSAPSIIRKSKKIIDVTGGFDQWDDVSAAYTDPSSDKGNRSNECFGRSTYTNKTGRNDIVNSKIIYDSYNVYFYVDTFADVVAANNGTTFMQLFINADMDASTGFYGFDYIVNYKTKDETTTTLAKAVSSGKEFAFEETEDIQYKLEGNKMMFRVPLRSLGIKDAGKIKFAFKWADSKTEITTMEQMYTDGDCAPHGRFSYVFQNCK